jgi:putative Ca2+/H+ antiporter (TMEM165/GDT1 family)
MVLLRQAIQAAIRRELSIAKLLSTLGDTSAIVTSAMSGKEHEMLKILGASALLLVSIRTKDE